MKFNLIEIRDFLMTLRDDCEEKNLFCNSKLNELDDVIDSIGFIIGDNDEEC